MARKQLNKRELCKILEDYGFIKKRTTDHEVWSNGNQTIVVPVHKINYKLSIKIQKQIGYN